ncbi:hypothetical protein ACPOL_6212 [Acidisarcina polymorpha]|uniref:Uncharacterized protein n=1 Tax=Acidisarcina polymorpha TaxID=2211140 RepID=A0A2Z5GA47_9BACT|nr:hypothetical protein ACPOL_6212 [Acidisarcina polymorpha]
MAQIGSKFTEHGILHKTSGFRHRIVPCAGVSVCQGRVFLVCLRIVLSHPEVTVDLGHSVLHEDLHLGVGDARVCRVVCAMSAKLSGMKVFEGPFRNANRQLFWHLVRYGDQLMSSRRYSYRLNDNPASFRNE